MDSHPFEQQKNRMISQVVSFVDSSLNTMRFSNASGYSACMVVEEMAIQTSRIKKRSRNDPSFDSSVNPYISSKKQRCISDLSSPFDDRDVQRTTSVEVITAVRAGTVTPEPGDRRTVRFNLEATTIHSLHRPSYSTSSVQSIMSDFTDDENSIKENGQLLKERQKLWYTRRELFKIRKEAKFISTAIDIDQELRQAFKSLDKLMSGQTKNAELFSINGADVQRLSSILSKSTLFRVQRGLERITCRTHESDRLFKQLRCKTEFFLEQSRQACEGSYNPDTLASLYHQLSFASATMACILGQADENIMLLLL